jgi:UDP-3-O-[3-hydroxymyristoyl] N-acetylglucosamine deacetylase
MKVRFKMMSFATTASFQRDLVRQESVTLESVGLISGRLVQATLRKASAGEGVTFILPQGVRIKATDNAVLDATRGVTLWDPSTQQRLSIVEHLLAAVALAGWPDLDVMLHAPDATTEAPCPIELPLLDGSALPWFDAIVETFGFQTQALTHRVIQPFFFHVNQNITLYALPSEHLELTYVLNYPHQDLRHQWASWSFQNRSFSEARHLLQARTFGEMKELPALQAQGLAKGVSLDNTLGLEEDHKNYSSPLRMNHEPLFHKMLDLLGDFYLSGISLAQVQGRLVALYAGHRSHLAFASHLKTAQILTPLSPQN